MLAQTHLQMPNGTTNLMKSHPEKSIVKVFIDPAKAKELLQKNTRNRKIKDRVVKEYATEMKEGRWLEDTFELIMIAEDGRVLNGQHRLLAVIKSGVTIPFHVAYNVSDGIFPVLDTGKTRGANDVFHIEGIKNDNLIPAVIRQYLVFKDHVGGKSFKISNLSLLDIYEQDPEFWQMVGRKTGVWYGNFAKILPPSTIGGLYALFQELDENNADEFFTQLTTGVNVSNNIILLLRTRLIQDRMSPRRVSITVKQALIIKAWNVFRGSRPLKQLKFIEAEEVFPVPI